MDPCSSDSQEYALGDWAQNHLCFGRMKTRADVLKLRLITKDQSQNRNILHLLLWIDIAHLVGVLIVITEHSCNELDRGLGVKLSTTGGARKREHESKCANVEMY